MDFWSLYVSSYGRIIVNWSSLGGFDALRGQLCIYIYIYVEDGASRLIDQAAVKTRPLSGRVVSMCFVRRSSFTNSCAFLRVENHPPLSLLYIYPSCNIRPFEKLSTSIQDYVPFLYLLHIKFQNTITRLYWFSKHELYSWSEYIIKNNNGLHSIWYIYIYIGEFISK